MHEQPSEANLLLDQFTSEARMPRLPRLHVPGAFYHVTLRGNHRQDIFFAPADRELFNQITGEVLDRFSARLHAYCLMTNHVHLLWQVGDAPLGRLMLRIASRYARTVQRRFRTTGHLFERRYHALLVDADEYLLELLRYIHLNPVRAQLVAHPADYPWSSHHAYLGARPENWVTTEFALRLFHSERDRAVEAYRRFMGEGIGLRRASPLAERNDNDVRILGNDQFVAKLLNLPLRPKPAMSLDDLLEFACRDFAVTRTALVSPSRHRHLTRVRAWIAHQAVTSRIASLSAVARLFNRSETALRTAVKRHFNYP